MTAGSQGGVGGRNQDSQTANEQQINKSLFSHSSLNAIYMPMEQQHHWARAGGCKRGWVWRVPRTSRDVTEGTVVPAPVPPCSPMAGGVLR